MMARSVSRKFKRKACCPSGVPARAASALYKLGHLAEQRGDRAAARTYYSRVIAGYPRSPEADLARQNQQRLRQ
jgi:TolA-binding protein